MSGAGYSLPAADDAVPGDANKLPAVRYAMLGDRCPDNRLPAGDDAVPGGEYAMSGWPRQRDGDALPAGGYALSR